MSSTGEVGCIGDNFNEAIITSMLSVGYQIPEKNVLISSGPAKSKVELLSSAKQLQKKGYNIYTTGGTHDFLEENGVSSTRLYWPNDDQQPNIMDYVKNKKLDLIINIPRNLTKGELDNGYKVRRGAVDHNIPLITNARLASAFINAFCTMTREDIAIKSWCEYK